MEDSTTPVTTPLENRNPSLLSYPEIQAWYQDNECIHGGYRAVSNSTHACFSSWLYLHNETVNIYSHLIPGVLFLAAEGLVYPYLYTQYPKATISDHLIFAFFILTAVICLVLSATYHTLMNHSKNISHLWLRLDYVGIIILTLGDFVSGIHMVFYCEPTLKKGYWAMIITLSAMTILILIHPKFKGPRWRTFRVSIFVGTGLSGFAPLIHGIIVRGFRQMTEQSGMPYYLTEGFLLLLGALFYTMRIPESLSPGKFDIFGASHQIFHVLVVIATVVHLIGIFSVFDYNYYRTCGL